ncbi:MAG: ATP-binding protein [Pseudomonadota bacterium]
MLITGLWRTRLGRKLVTLMILASAALSVLASALQLYTAFERDRDRAFAAFTTIDESFRDGLESAIWEFNYPQIQLLLDGIFAQADVVYLKLETPTGEMGEIGSAAGDDLIIRDFALNYEVRPGEVSPMGTLRAGISLRFVYARLWDQFLALTLSNFAKTFLATIAMLLIFEAVAARHLRAISSQIGTAWLETTGSIEIDRPPQRAPDEIDEIVASLNQARAEGRRAHAALADKLEELAALNARLANTNREQSEFTYAISHDLKSPANTVRMLLQELREIRGETLEGDEGEIFNDLEMTIERMGQLVEDVLVYSRSVGEGMEVERVDLAVETGRILQDLAGDVKEAGAEVSVAPLPVIEGNPMQLRLLLQNLITNALKFRDPDRPPRIEITATEPRPGWVGVAIRDNGIGIDPAYHEHIFGLFKRLHTHSAYQGSGIGLTVCHRIVTNHGGRIELTSDEGTGSTFRFELPEEPDGAEDPNRNDHR